MIKNKQSIATILLIEGILSLFIGLVFLMIVFVSNKYYQSSKLLFLSLTFLLIGLGFLVFRYYYFIRPELQEELQSQTAQRRKELMKEYEPPANTDSASVSGMQWDHLVDYRWRVAAVLMSIVALALFVASMRSDTGEKKGIPGETIGLIEAPLKDAASATNHWSDSLVFPGSARKLEGNMLSVAFPLPMIDGTPKLTIDGEFYMNQLVSITQTSSYPLRIELLSYGTGSSGTVARFKSGLKRSSAIAEHLVEQGIPPEDIVVRSSDGLPDDLNYGQVVRVGLRRKTIDETRGQWVEKVFVPVPASVTTVTVAAASSENMVQDRVVERIVEVPVEKVVEVPVETIVEKIVEVPVEKIVERIVEKRVEVPVEVIVEKLVEKPIDTADVLDRVAEMMKSDSLDRAVLLALTGGTAGDVVETSPVDPLLDSVPFSITSVEICRSIEGYGVYDAVSDYTIHRRSPEPVLLYTEVDAFTHIQLSNGLYEVTMAQELALYKTGEESQPPVWKGEPSQISDLSRNARRDFFLAQYLILPPEVKPGEYELQVTVKDIGTGQDASRRIPVVLRN